MVLIIGGHPRSGTTLLRRLCDKHPDMAVTIEFGSLLGFGQPYQKYRSNILNRWLTVRNRWAFNSSYAGSRLKILGNLAFTTRYLRKMQMRGEEIVDFAAIDKALHSLFPNANIVGDKFPDYVFHLDTFAGIKGLRRLIIYRDCRDVVSSTLHMVRTTWRNQPWTAKMDTASKIAKRWVHAIELMEHHKKELHAIRYEDLVREPNRELETLSNWLGVNPQGFPHGMIKDSNIGKYKSKLSDEELQAVMEVAGATMTRLGYL